MSLEYRYRTYATGDALLLHYQSALYCRHILFAFHLKQFGSPDQAASSTRLFYASISWETQLIGPLVGQSDALTCSCYTRGLQISQNATMAAATLSAPRYSVDDFDTTSIHSAAPSYSTFSLNKFLVLSHETTNS